MENSVKIRLMNGLTSALLLAPVVAPAANVIAQEADETGNESTPTTIYEADFSEGTYPDSVAISSGDAELEWSDQINVAGNENGSGVWVRNRTNNYDGIDIPFETLGIEEGVAYSIEVMGYIAEDEAIPDGLAMNLETTVPNYSWIHSLNDISAGETFRLEGTHVAAEGEDRFRIKTNNDAEMEFAVTNIIITTEEDTENNGGDYDPSLLYHETFIDGLGSAQQAGGATLEHLPEFSVGDRTGAVYITNRIDNHDGIDLP
ncbi:MAG: hypothetical protein ABS873_00265, partial [Alkalibacterium sp.]